MIKRLRRLWPLALSAFFGFVIAGIFLTPTAYSRNANMYQVLKEKMNVLDQIIRYVNHFYFDTVDYNLSNIKG